MMRDLQSAREREKHKASKHNSHLALQERGISVQHDQGFRNVFFHFSKGKNLLFNYSVFCLLCAEEELCSDLCLSLAKDSYHPELQHQGSYGKLLKGNTALLKP